MNGTSRMTGFSALKAFARRSAGTDEAGGLHAETRCDLCATVIPEEHEHLLASSASVSSASASSASGSLRCGCDACVRVLANNDEWRRVPHRIDVLVDFDLSTAEWESLRLPIDLAFFQKRENQERTIAVFPSPAGATESTVSEGAWDLLASREPRLNDLARDVEALLVNRLPTRQGNARDAFIVSIDECYRLIGLVRAHWRGIHGGSAVGIEVERFFDDLRARGRACRA